MHASAIRWRLTANDHNICFKYYVVFKRSMTILLTIKLLPSMFRLSDFSPILSDLRPELFWFLLMFNSVIASCCIIQTRTPIYSLLSLITLFMHVIILLLALGVEFLGLIFLIIYVGAIAILFLFVIMLFRLKDLQQTNTISDTWICTAAVYLVILPKAYYVVTISVSKLLVARSSVLDLVYLMKYKSNDVLIFSDCLYSYYAAVFLLTGVVLLLAMLGSIVLALSTIEGK